jgi:protein-L-isoaspartate(D-aspartate) O-methyltransferase
MAYIRHGMVEQLKKRGISSGTLLDAMAIVPRHLFVSEALRYRAYDDTSLPIGSGQTVSRPWVIALMIQSLMLRGRERVLEIGTGSGYQSAVLSHLCASVVTMERVNDLSVRAGSVISLLGYSNIQLIASGDFSRAEGLFDAVVVAAGTDILPDELLGKLNPGGTLVIPVSGRGRGHEIKRFIKREEGSFYEDVIGGASFVPLILEESA